MSRLMPPRRLLAHRRPALAAALLLVASCALFAPVGPLAGTAGAHVPGRFEWITAGSYKVLLGLPKGSVPAGRSFPIDVITPEQATSWDLWAHPGPGTDAVSVHAHIEPAIAMAELSLPTVGDWVLDVSVEGAAGEAHGQFTVVAAEPRKMPVWLAWCIALMPLGGFALFCLREWRRVVRESA